MMYPLKNQGPKIYLCKKKLLNLLLGSFKMSGTEYIITSRGLYLQGRKGGLRILGRRLLGSSAEMRGMFNSIHYVGPSAT